MNKGKLNKEILMHCIANIDDAKAFIDELHRCNRLFHFDDDPLHEECFITHEAICINDRLVEMFKIIDGWGESKDPYGYALDKLYK